MQELEVDELQAIESFAKQYGKDWKKYLFAAWQSSTYKGLDMSGKDSGTLRAIRNKFGNEWLRKFKLP